jgi:hypothetical protein
MLSEEERKAIVESGPIYLKDGMRATLGGWKNPYMCSITSALPGFWHMSWETVKAITERPNRRQEWHENMFNAGWGWLGYTPQPNDYQTPEDYELAKAKGFR